jgi:integrase
MTSKRGFLSDAQVRKIEGMSLIGKLDIVRDVFLLSCYTGLRFSDIKTLKDENLQKGIIIKKMVKTQLEVRIPIRELFDGKTQCLIDKYGSVDAMIAKVGSNATVNKILKEVFKKAGCADKGFTFHTARHTFASLLLQDGIQLSTIQHLLGHANIQTTGIYAEVTDKVIANDLRKTTKRKAKGG